MTMIREKRRRGMNSDDNEVKVRRKLDSALTGDALVLPTRIQSIQSIQSNVLSPLPQAKVWLLGCGPGSADLLTVRGLRLIQSADVVLYDRLVSEEILSLVNPSALMVYVGKQEGYHTRSQESISELLGVYASELGSGANVLRLKGGDPFVFGRGGEEAEYLRSVGVDVGVVPGITSACAIGAELGIPLTHRTLATSVRFLTGHARENGQSDIDEAMATAFDTKTTLVIYMGLRTLDKTVETLVEGGLPRDTPAAAVERGCTPEQRVVFSTLEDLYDAVQGAEPKLVSPTLIVIGQVVKLAPGYPGEGARERRTKDGGQGLDGHQHDRQMVAA